MLYMVYTYTLRKLRNLRNFKNILIPGHNPQRSDFNWSEVFFSFFFFFFLNSSSKSPSGNLTAQPALVFRVVVYSLDYTLDAPGEF